jgi:hypothetical protein
MVDRLRHDIGQWVTAKPNLTDADMSEFHRAFGQRIKDLASQLSDCANPSVKNLYLRELQPTMHVGRIGALMGDLDSLKTPSKDWKQCTQNDAK